MPPAGFEPTIPVSEPAVSATNANICQRLLCSRRTDKQKSYYEQLSLQTKHFFSGDVSAEVNESIHRVWAAANAEIIHHISVNRRTNFSAADMQQVKRILRPIWNPTTYWCAHKSQTNLVNFTVGCYLSTPRSSKWNAWSVPNNNFCAIFIHPIRTTCLTNLIAGKLQLYHFVTLPVAVFLLSLKIKMVKNVIFCWIKVYVVDQTNHQIQPDWQPRSVRHLYNFTMLFGNFFRGEQFCINFSTSFNFDHMAFICVPLVWQRCARLLMSQSGEHSVSATDSLCTLWRTHTHSLHVWWAKGMWYAWTFGVYCALSSATWLLELQTKPLMIESHLNQRFSVFSYRLFFLSQYRSSKRLRWCRGSVLAFSIQVHGFKPGRSRRIFRVKKSSARLPSEGK